MGVAGSLSVVAVVALLGASGFACTTTSTSSGAPDGGGAPSAEGGAATATALSCSGILGCVSKCADGDTACVNACVMSGSPEGQDAVNNILTCVQKNACMDSACYQSKCSKELEACSQSAHSGSQPLAGAAPAGSIPADLVGRWSGLEDQFNFSANGSCFRTSDIKGSCETKSVENCTAVADGTTLTLYFTSGSFTICGMASTDPYMPTTEVFTFTVDATTLHLTRQNCTGGLCGSGYDKF